MNKSGISPRGNRVVVKPDSIEEVTEGGIVIAPSVIEKHQQAQATGVLIAAGPDAWEHVTEKVYTVHPNGERQLTEVRVRGYSGPFAKEGERVAFAKYGGLVVEGEDGEEYRILNDEDITCGVSDEVKFTDIKSRKRVGDKR